MSRSPDYIEIQKLVQQIDGVLLSYRGRNDELALIKEEVLQKVGDLLRCFPQVDEPNEQGQQEKQGELAAAQEALFSYLAQLKMHQKKWESATQGTSSKVKSVLNNIFKTFGHVPEPSAEMKAKVGRIFTTADQSARCDLLVELAKDYPELLEMVLLDSKAHSAFMKMLILNHKDLSTVLQVISGFRAHAQLEIVFPSRTHASPVEAVIGQAPNYFMTLVDMVEPLLAVKRVPALLFRDKEHMCLYALKKNILIADPRLLVFYIQYAHLKDVQVESANANLHRTIKDKQYAPAISPELTVKYNEMQQIVTDYDLISGRIEAMIPDLESAAGAQSGGGSKDAVHAFGMEAFTQHMQLQQLLRELIDGYSTSESKQKAEEKLIAYCRGMDSGTLAGLSYVSQLISRQQPEVTGGSDSEAEISTPKFDVQTEFFAVTKLGYNHAKRALQNLMSAPDLHLYLKIHYILNAEIKVGENTEGLPWYRLLRDHKIFHALMPIDIIKLYKSARLLHEFGEHYEKFALTLMAALERKKGEGLTINTDYIRLLCDLRVVVNPWFPAYPGGGTADFYEYEEQINFIKERVNQYIDALLVQSSFDTGQAECLKLVDLLKYLAAFDVNLLPFVTAFKNLKWHGGSKQAQESSAHSQVHEIYSELMLQLIVKDKLFGEFRESLKCHDDYLNCVLGIYRKVTNIRSLSEYYASKKETDLTQVKKFATDKFLSLFRGLFVDLDDDSKEAVLSRYWREDLLSFFAIIDPKTRLGSVVVEGTVSRLKNHFSSIIKDLRESLRLGDSEFKPRKQFIESELASIVEKFSEMKIYFANVMWVAAKYYPELILPYMTASDDQSDEYRTWQDVLISAAKREDGLVYSDLLNHFLSVVSLGEARVFAVVAKSLACCATYDCANAFLGPLPELTRGKLLAYAPGRDSEIILRKFFMDAPFTDFVDSLLHSSGVNNRSAVLSVQQVWQHKINFYREMYISALEASSGEGPVPDYTPSEGLAFAVFYAEKICDLNEILNSSQDDRTLVISAKLKPIFRKLLQLEKMQTGICTGHSGRANLIDLCKDEVDSNQSKLLEYYQSFADMLVLLAAETVQGVPAELAKFVEDIKNRIIFTHCFSKNSLLSTAILERVLQEEQGIRHKVTHDLFSGHEKLSNQKRKVVLDSLCRLDQQDENARDLIASYMLHHAYFSLVKLSDEYQERSKKRTLSATEEIKQSVTERLLETLADIGSPELTQQKEYKMIQELAMYLPIIECCQVGAQARLGLTSRLSPVLDMLDQVVKQQKGLPTDEKITWLRSLIDGVCEETNKEFKLGILNYLLKGQVFLDLVPYFLAKDHAKSMLAGLASEDPKRYLALYQKLSVLDVSLDGLPIPPRSGSLAAVSITSVRRGKMSSGEEVEMQELDRSGAKRSVSL